MLRKLQYVFLVGSIGLIGADRIDLFAGRGSFILTPFLVLAPLVVLLHLLRTGLRGTLHFAITPPVRRQVPFVAASCLFLLLSFASIPLSLDPERSLVAFCDLLLVAVLGYCISLQILAEPAQERLIVRSVTLALFVYVIFCIAECIAWSHGLVIDADKSGSWLQSTFTPSTLGPWVPTLSGTTFDSNRSGFVLTMYLALLDRFAVKSRYLPVLRVTIALLVFLTLSRSSMLCWLAYYLSASAVWTRLVSRRVLVRIATVAVVGSLLGVAYQKEIVGLAEAWEISDAVSAKMSMDPGSSGESHILLIQRGFDTWLTSTKTIITGIGFAAAPKVLEDFFGNDKRGNFHNLYVTALAEMGFPAFLILMFLLVYPIIGRKGAASGMAAIMVFNVSYQSHTEPVFWLVLALLWSYEWRGSPALRWLAFLPRPGDRRLAEC
ncbi:MAG: O-antigen ligase family protein [Terriglobales bacterium]